MVGILIVFISMSMLHDTSGIPIRIVRERELGQYDTTIDTVKSLFNFNNYYKTESESYPKPKYFIEQIRD